MLFWFKVLVRNLLLLAIATASSNKSQNKTVPLNHLSIKENVEHGLSVREVDVDTWTMEALKYNTSAIHSLHEINTYLKLLAACPYGHVKLQHLTIRRVRARLDAVTEKGNYIPYLNISVGSYLKKPAIAIVGGAKGCHWLTVAAAMNLAQQLVVHYDKNYEHTSRITWIVIPVLNPDGYNLTLSDKNMRNWPKNMAEPPKQKISRSKPQYCFGVNLCLNFEYQWSPGIFINKSWCDLDYADKPFTQNESKGVRDTIMDHLDSVKIFVTLSQNNSAIMYPFRYTLLKPMFWKMYENIIKSALDAAFKQHGRTFAYGHVSKFYGKTAAGELDDWIMAHLGVSLGFTFEIREWKSNNETPSTQEIKWTNDETFAALKIIAKQGVGFDEMGYLPGSLNNNCRKRCIISIFSFITVYLLRMLFVMLN